MKSTTKPAQTKIKKKLGESLVEAGVITDKDLTYALAEQARTGEKLGKILIDLAYTTETEIVYALAHNQGFEYIELPKAVIEADAVKVVPVALAEKHFVMPVKIVDSKIIIAMCDPLDISAIGDLEFVTGKKVHRIVATLSEIRRAIQHYYHNKKPRKLGDILVETGVLSQEQLDLCIAKQKTMKKRLGSVIIHMGFSTEIEIARTLSSQLDMPYVDLTFVGIQPDVIKLINKGFALRRMVIPITATSRKVEIAMADPMDIDTIREVKYMVNRDVDVVISTPTEIDNAIRFHFSEATYNWATKQTEINAFDRLNELFEQEKGTAVTTSALEIKPEQHDVDADSNKVLHDSNSHAIIQLVHKIISSAVKSKASDIHMEPRDKLFRVRLRVDGIMIGLTQLSKTTAPALVSRIKVMAKMDIAERRIPQDGRIRVNFEGKPIDLRVSTLPTQFGEKVVIRVLDLSLNKYLLSDIGLSESDYALALGMIEKPQGLVLVTGPTGSGKSTTLFAALNCLSNDKTNIITIENPVEYNLKEATQVNIAEKSGLTFASTLRSVLRQDPDIIMVGEMRDPETAEVAVQASITGHLVLSTLHTTTAVAAISRLKGMGIRTHFLSSSLNGVIAQRLVRKLCPKCKQDYIPSMDEFMMMGIGEHQINSKVVFYKPQGCEQCSGSGYAGRIGIYECLRASTKVKKLIFDDADEHDILHAAVEAGMTSIIEDGIDKARRGITSLEEVLRVVSNMSDIDEVVACPDCKITLSADFVFCPFCGSSLKHKCPKCSNPRNSKWKFCPYCHKMFN